ncbi:hypothetical protein FNV62_00200 [Streptomyces sp. RLB3-17]|uniref:hypothetical protein n=1 Tax=unclassified Streptomyces TaxID=2593676 RepID=UPI0011650E92|nr:MULTISPECIES: hypothetical protein [unclassified Streptomyces]QDN95045.1 hypothetical protein FNV58_01610 [Streptomyces sp. RLB1-9]QDO16769.1 hypothetical protein FNV65_00180 [Streptomyces sp. S1A1-8]QDO26892.1 hypothetical protein FNV63_00175 [Streptomyces sp. S1A1-3]QDO36932.1 hypothetical protein FNV62_00200 [Streptomyces sp. RLB3-17]
MREIVDAVLVDVVLCPSVDFFGGDAEVGEQYPGGRREGVVRGQRGDAGSRATMSASMPSGS